MPAVDAPRSILIVKLSAIGDVLMATPSARALREAFPESHIAWVVEKKAADVVLGNPYLDEVIIWERTRGTGKLERAGRFASSFSALARTLRSRRFDVCVDLQGLIRSAAVCVASGAKRRVGFADAAEGSTYFYHAKHRPDSEDLNAQQRNLDILQALGVHSTNRAMFMPVSDADRAFAGDLLAKQGLAGKRVVAFCPATTWANKHWQPEWWSKTADLLEENHGVKSVILGSPADVALAGKIVAGARHKPAICAGQTTLKQAGALMEHSLAVIGVDTGLLHMAVALDRPAVGLFGASAWRCFLKRDNFVWLAKEFPCSPCFRHPTCTDQDCMRAILPEDVVQAVRPWVE